MPNSNSPCLRPGYFSYPYASSFHAKSRPGNMGKLPTLQTSSRFVMVSLYKGNMESQVLYDPY